MTPNDCVIAIRPLNTVFKNSIYVYVCVYVLYAWMPWRARRECYPVGAGQEEVPRWYPVAGVAAVAENMGAGNWISTIWKSRNHPYSPVHGLCVCACVRVCVCMHLCVHVHVCTCVRVYMLCVHVCTQVHVYVRVCACVLYVWWWPKGLACTRQRLYQLSPIFWSLCKSLTLRQFSTERCS